MNKKLRRLVQPGVVLYFIVMIAFCVAAAALRHFVLAAAEAGVTLVLLGVSYLRDSRRRKALTAYIQSTSELMERTKGEVPFPVALVKLNDNELVWCNKAFSDLTGLGESVIAPRVAEIFPGLSLQWLTGAKPQNGTELRYRDRRYRVSGRFCRRRILAPAWCWVCCICSTRPSFCRCATSTSARAPLCPFCSWTTMTS